MSDELDQNSENHYSSFWPLLVLISGLLIWFAFQDYLLNIQRSAYERQFHDQQFLTVVGQADNVTTRYVALMKDLVDTAQKQGKDSAAAKIVNEAIAANLIHVTPNATNGSGTPAEPPK
jgi:hypothetical protein